MSNYNNTYTEGTGDTIDTTDFSTEFSAIETAVNSKYDDTDFLDEDDMASDDDTKIASQQSIKAYVDANSVTDQAYTDTQITAKTADLNTKIITITTWNMDTVQTVAHAHGLGADWTKIRSINVTIKNNAATRIHDFSASNDGECYADATNITVIRETSGTFDNPTYNAATGFIVIQYTD